MVYWSEVCPVDNACDFSLIDRVIARYRDGGKKIVLDVATMGFPLSIGNNLVSATPVWVMADVSGYDIKSRSLGSSQVERVIRVPDFRDPKFLQAVANFVSKLKRYDGNPSVAQVRIATGMMGEDNPPIGPVGRPVNGISETEWLMFTIKTARLYFSAFQHTQLEFDIGRLSWMGVRGSAVDGAEVDNFLRELFAHRAMLAFDGLSPEVINELRDPSRATGSKKSISYLMRYKSWGGSIGLEAVGPASSPRMTDHAAIAEAVHVIEPDRVVLFGDEWSPAGQVLLNALGYH